MLTNIETLKCISSYQKQGVFWYLDAILAFLRKLIALNFLWSK